MSKILVNPYQTHQSKYLSFANQLDGMSASIFAGDGYFNLVV
tara:strand:+ start:769 stop:894 length:126 start_codon:yes stop_codon:yes gene_type:complete